VIRTLARSLWLGLLIGTSALASIGPIPRWVEDATQERIRKENRSGRLPGVTLAIIEDGELRHAGSFGIADRTHRTPLILEQLHPWGSASQLPMAMLVLSLVEAGQLDLDATLAELLPSERLAGSELDVDRITLRDLLTHHAGLPTGRLQGLLSETPQTPQNLAEPQWLYAARPPRQLHSYTPVGLALVRDIVEHATGTDYSRLLRDVVFAPLGVKAGFHPDTLVPSGHQDKKALPRHYTRDPEVVGLEGSAEDLARLAAALFRDQGPWSTESLRTLTEPQNGDVPLDFGNGVSLGLYVRGEREPGMGPTLRFGTEGEGFRGEVRLLPAHRFGVIVLGNSADARGEVNRLAEDVLAAFLTRRLGREVKFAREELPPQLAVPAGVTLADAMPRYATPGGLLDTRPFDGGFDFDVLGLKFRAYQRDDGWYRIRWRALGLVPIGFGPINRVVIAPARFGDRDLLLGNGFGTPVLLGSALAAESTAEDAELPLGRYRLLNPDAPTRRLKLSEVQLRRENGQLLAEYEVPSILTVAPRMPLTVRDRDTLVLSGLGPLLGERVHVDRSGPRVRLDYAGYQFEYAD
jgi:CubicO group peptidase (beta-lactamase class C family)